MSRVRAETDRPQRELPTRPESSAPLRAPAATLSNRGLAALLGVHREEGWPKQGPGSKNRGGPTEFKAPGGGVVRRHALRGIKSAQMLTDQAIVVVPDGLPRDGSPVDVLVHLHGFEIWNEARTQLHYGTGYEDARARGGAQPIDIGVMKLEQQMAAAGRPLVGVLPQGSAASDFSKAGGKGFDLPSYVQAVFDRLTEDGGWGPAVGAAGADKPPTPGRAVLSGHSGADQPIAEMLEGGGSGELAGLFLFDTMIVGDREKAARPKGAGAAAKAWRPKFEGAVEKYVLKRLDDDLAKLLKAQQGGDPAKSAQIMKTYVQQRGFRLNVVWRNGGPYHQAGTLLRAAVDDWFAKLDPKTVGEDVSKLLRMNYRLHDVPKEVDHMDVMAHGEGLRQAVEMLPLGAVAPAGGSAPAPSPAPSSDPKVNRAVAAMAPATGNRAVAHVLGSPARPTIQRDDTEEVDYAAEFASFAVRGAVEGGLAGYKDIRDLLIDTFGSIARANTYYRGVRGVDFLDRKPQVHVDTLGDRLGKAETLMKEKEKLLKDTAWHTDLKANVRAVGGFNVRRNRNDRSKLSDHSFGWAVDVDAAENPNLHERFPGRALMAATGEDIFTGAMGTVSLGGTAEELLAPIEEIRAASQAFKDAFHDEASLAQAMRDYLVTRLKFDLAPGLSLLDMVKAAAGRGKAGTKARKELSDHLKEHWTNIPEAEEWLEAEDREEIVANKGWGAWKKEKAKREKAREKAEAQSRAERAAAAATTDKLRKAGKTDEEISKLVRDPLVAKQVARFEAELDAIAGKAAGTLIEMWKIFVSSFQGGRTGGGARVGAQTEGTPGTVAAHGFMNMPDRLAAALAGSDGGNLDWLGAELARDFMHFQLKAANRPSLR